MVNQPISMPHFWDGNIVLQALMTVLPLAMTAVRSLNNKRSFPVQVMVTDIRNGAGLATDPIEAEQELVRFGVNVLTSTPANLQALSILNIPGNSVTVVFNEFGLQVYDAIEAAQEGKTFDNLELKI